MQYRTLGKTGFKISEISLGTWQVGGRWGNSFDDQNADKILNAAIDAGINFIDTADVYSEGLSETAVGRIIRHRSEKVYIATKCGRQLNPHVASAYTPASLEKFVDDSLRRTGLEHLDLIQLHCPPTEVYYRPEIFAVFEKMKQKGKIQHLGVSVEKVEEGLKAMAYDNVTSVQIIFNIFRQRPAELFFREAAKRNVGIIVRVPLASGLLTGQYSSQTTFGPDDHHNFNRDGAAFDKGETFAGIPYEKGLNAVAKIKAMFPERTNLAPTALKWILEFPEVSCIIPGASKLAHLTSNLSTFDLPDFTQAEKDALQVIYQEDIKPLVHQLW